MRIESAGAVYHVMARGNQGREIFPGDPSRECFLETVGEAGEKTGWWVDGCESNAGGGPDATKTGKEIGALETATIANGGTKCLKSINVTFLGLTLSQYGEERAQTAAEQAEGMVRVGWRRLGWNEAALEARAKGDREKLKLAVRVRAETAVTIKWIAQRMRMGTWNHLNHLLY